MLAFSNAYKILLFVPLLFAACQRTHEVQTDGHINFFHQEQATSPSGVINSVHTVEVLEHMRGAKYSYLRVLDEGQETWLATMGGDFRAGVRYHYSEGLEKMQYHSTEFDRTFERIVLVSALHPLESDVDPVHSNMEQPIVAHPDSRSIASIVRDAGQLKGKRILVSGRISKVNPDIMDRNWIHLVDGSMDSYDFVLTTDELFPVGHVITFEGILNLDRDLGAGYHFDLLLENAHSIQ